MADNKKETSVEPKGDPAPGITAHHASRDMAVKQSYTDTFCSKSLIIGVSGIIGAGKSTLSRSLGETFGAKVLYEPVETNEYLGKFYKNMAKYSFAMQVYLLNHRFEQHQKMIWSGSHTIQDRTIYEDVIFAKMLRESGHMEELDFQTYRHLFQNMCNFLHRPDIIVYLDVEPEEALRRVKMRSRGCECNIPVEYLAALKNGYEEWLEDVEPRIPVLRLDWSEFRDTKVVADAIRKKLATCRRGLII
jgi:deoxyadenosine kinase